MDKRSCFVIIFISLMIMTCNGCVRIEDSDLETTKSVNTTVTVSQPELSYSPASITKELHYSPTETFPTTHEKHSDQTNTEQGPQTETNPKEPVITDDSLLNSSEIVDEHLRMIDEANAGFVVLLEENRLVLEQLVWEMLALQRSAVTENPERFADPQKSSRWKCPYYRENSINWDFDANEGRNELLLNIEAELNTLSADGTFQEVYPDLDCLILEGDICQFKRELVDSHGNYFCAVSLMYCEQENPEIHPYYTVEWLDEHWFLYKEWHE